MLAVESGVVRCPAGHSFDIAREGYVTLLGGGGAKVTGDTGEMLAARANFLGAGHYLPIADAVAAAIVDPDAVLEIGAGTGYYLSHVLDRHESAVGIGFDISKAAARRTARAHPRAASVVADAWREWPFADSAFTHVMSVFAPRNAVEIQRVLVPGGRYVVVTPQTDHLVELQKRVSVDENKAQRLQQTLDGRFELESTHGVRFAARLSPVEAVQAVAMGPSGHHSGPDISPAGPTDVTVAVDVAVYRRLAR